MASMVIIAVPIVAIVFHFVVVAVLGCSAVEQVVIRGRSIGQILLIAVGLATTVHTISESPGQVRAVTLLGNHI